MSKWVPRQNDAEAYQAVNSSADLGGSKVPAQTAAPESNSVQSECPEVKAPRQHRHCHEDQNVHAPVCNKRGSRVESSDDDDDEVMREAQSLEQRFVGLVIGKAGETIKSFKKLTSCHIEIEQNLPEGLPRIISYRGTRKQISAAKKLVAQLLDKTKEDEKSRESSARGPDGEIIWRRSTGPKKSSDAPPVLGSLTSESTGRPAWMSSRRTAAASEEDLGAGKVRESAVSGMRSPTREGELVYHRNLMLACRDLAKGDESSDLGITMGERPVVEEVKVERIRSSELPPETIKAPTLKE